MVIRSLSYPSSRSGEPDDDHFTRFNGVLERIGEAVAAAECAQMLSTGDVESDLKYIITLV